MSPQGPGFRHPLPFSTNPDLQTTYCLFLSLYQAKPGSCSPPTKSLHTMHFQQWLPLLPGNLGSFR